MHSIIWRLAYRNNWWDKVTNEEVLRRAGNRSVFQTLQIRCSRWLGHLRRMPGGFLPKEILYSELCTGSRPRGPPMLRFKDVAKRDIAALGVDMNQ